MLVVYLQGHGIFHPAAVLLTITEFFGKMGTEPKTRTKRYLQNHVVYQRTKMILRSPLAIPVREARQNGHAPSHAFGWAQKAIYAGSIVISLDAGYRDDAEDFQPERRISYWERHQGPKLRKPRKIVVHRSTRPQDEKALLELLITE